jgi:tyrosyl-tRNA synthetase
MAQTLSEELTWRGFVNQTTFEDIQALDTLPMKFYWGVDPSAASMTVGHLAVAMMIRHFIKAGHKPVLLVGGATGLIGDPDGKAQERDLKTTEEIEKNVAGIKAQYQNIFAGEDLPVVNNFDWFKDFRYLDFLREVGKHVPMRQMLGREFVQSRLGEDGAGISYAEFSYSLIQGYDFLHLYKEHRVTLQVCGADQWGNCIAGVELVRRIAGGEAHIWSAPLVINKATGVKFGKSEAGAIWLDPALTSPYKFYQFWLNTDDESVKDYLKLYTLLDKNEFDSLIKDFNEDKSSRLAQRTLAFEVTKIVHGQERAESVQKISEVLFGNRPYEELRIEDFISLGEELGLFEAASGVDLIGSLVDAGLATSKGEARRFLDGNAIYINGSQIPLSKTTLDSDDAIDGYVVLRRGKNSQVIIELKG